MSDVVKHEAEETGELKKDGQNNEIGVFLKIIIYTLVKNEAESWEPTCSWSCSPAYSMDWKMFQVYLRRISRRAM